MEEVLSLNLKQVLALLEQVNKTKKPSSHHAPRKPVAEVVPPSSVKDRSAWIGSMKDRMEILGDISPRQPMRASGRSCAIEALLDTHIWLWGLREPNRLGPRL